MIKKASVFVLSKNNGLSGDYLQTVFPAEFSAQIISTANEGLRQMRINTYLLLAYALHQYGVLAPYRIEKDSAGKPFIAQCPVDFSITHTEGISAVVVSTARCGIDAEDTMREASFLAIAQSFFHPDEYSDLNSGGDVKNKFYRYWTAKESLFKLTGAGMKRELSQKKIFDEISALGMCYDSWMIESFLVASLTREGASLVRLSEDEIRDFSVRYASDR